MARATLASPSTGTRPALKATDPHKVQRGDRLFKLVAAAAGSTIVIAIAADRDIPVDSCRPVVAREPREFLHQCPIQYHRREKLAFGIRDLFMVTVLSSISALVVAVPVAVGIAVFLTQYAPKRLARPFAAMVDLLAAVPSIIFGLWGIFVLAPKLEPFAAFLNRNLGWLFLFKQGNVSLAGGGTIFTAGIVLSVMILPIVTSVSREVFRQTPPIQMEAAQALGATKWEVVRMTVLPFGRSGVIAASMLGLGRALGETVAVLIILRSAARAGQLVAVRRRVHVRFQDRLRGIRIQRTAAYRGLHRRGICAVRPDFHRQRGRPHDRRREGQRMTADALDHPVKAEVFSPISLWRRTKNNAATTFFVASFVGALVPLVWVLRGGGRTGLVRRYPVRLVDPLTARRAARGVCRRRVSRAVWDVGAGRGGRHSGRAAGLDDRGVSGGIRFWPAGAGDDLHGRRARRGALDRGGAVHLQPLDRHLGISSKAPLPCRWRWSC